MADSLDRVDLKTLNDVSALSKALQEGRERVKEATICIDLGDGASGSGVIVSKDGLVLSAAHVTQEVGKKLTAITEDGTSYEMVALGLDTSSDASFAQITSSITVPPKGFPHVELSEEIAVGQYVFSLGHAGGFDLERGSVLRLGRVIEIESTSMRTDCTLIGGDSGGPLFDLEGRLIGIHSRVGTVTNSNTHVPIKVFKEQWDELKDGAVKGDGSFADAGIPFLGMRLQEKDGGLLVIQVIVGSQAYKQGVRRGEVLTKLNAVKLTSGAELLKALKGIEDSDDGVDVELSFLSENRLKTVTLVF